MVRYRLEMLDREQYSKQIDRLVASRTLHGSESLCKLLRYLASHALEHPGTPLKEYQIATEVFGRRPDFDPQSDSTIRVQAGRLRAKVAEYYASEGESDPVVVELPKGSYLLTFRYRTPVPKEEPVVAAHPVEAPTPVVPVRTYAGTVRVLVILLALAAVTIGYLLVSGRPKGDTASAAVGGPVAPMEFQVFWKNFLSGPEEPWVVFSNAEFVGRPETGMRYYDKQRDANTPPYDHYTGVGEVLAVHQLDEVFGSLHRGIRVKRGSLFSLDDAKNNDLIFIGSPSENLTLMEIPSTEDFVFDRVKSGPRAGDLAVFNVHPQAGEQPYYMATPAGSPTTEDYAVVGLMPALNPQRREVILAGTTTFGTQAAVEYVCRQSTVKQLLARLGVSNGEVRPFEALLHIKVAKGVPVETELVAVRLRNQ